jgi:hypothetical protein
MNGTTDGVIDHRYFYLGVLNLFITIISIVWLMVGILSSCIYKRRFWLQFQLFLCLFLNRVCRTFTLLIFYQVCAFSRGDQTSCKIFSRFNQSIDLLASALNFTSFLLLVCFWAEQFHSQRFKEEEEFTREFEKLQRRIRIIFWSLVIAVYTIWLCLSLTIIIFGGFFDSKTIVYNTIRTFYRVILSIGISIAVGIYGLALYLIQNEKVKKIAWITIICTTCYLGLVCWNLIFYAMTVSGWVWWNHVFQPYYGWIISNLTGLVEIVANGILLLALTPQEFLLLCCKKVNSLSLDETFYSKVPLSVQASFQEPKRYYFE